MYLKSRDKKVIVACVTIFLVFFVGMCCFIHKKTNTDFSVQIVEVEQMPVPFKQPSFGKTIMSEEEYESLFSSSNGSASSFETYTDYVASVNMSADSPSAGTVTADGANKELYDFANTYFQAYYGAQRVNPILPLAIANVETPGRADNTITWSALFPSKIVDISRMATFNVSDVVTDDKIFPALSAEYSTRDRGALQMSPTYGTNNKSLNALMSGTEKEKLKASGNNGHGTWASGASSESGDRFYLPDLLLRMSAAMQYQCDLMARNNWTPSTDIQLVAMCAMGHHNSGVWYYKSPDKKVGAWNSVSKAYEWSQVVSTPEMIAELTDYANTHDSMFIDGSTATTLYNKHNTTPMSNYASKTIVCTYPIKAMYAYIKLCTLYTK